MNVLHHHDEACKFITMKLPEGASAWHKNATIKLMMYGERSRKLLQTTKHCGFLGRLLGWVKVG
jgi:hypothetical protein